MGRLVQIRDVPEPVHRTLKARAAQSGRSLSEYLRVELARLAALPTPDEAHALSMKVKASRPDEEFDRGTDVTRHLDVSKARRPGRGTRAGPR
jgi:plasmid stability protein